MKFILLFLLYNIRNTNANFQDNIYNLGVGRADVTGPAAEVTFFGYGSLSQRGEGIHLRQFSRAFIIDDDTNRFVFVSVDILMINHFIRKQVIENLKIKYGDKLYSEENVMISATHTHSGPGGYNEYLFYGLSVLGYVGETYNTIVSGITKSVEKAHDSIQKGKIYWNKGTLLNITVNRSPTSYMKNPEYIRNKYEYNTDKEMTQLRFEDLNGNLIGLINWFAIHPTSMNNTNTLISSDNVGYASILMEQHFHPRSLPGKSKYVTAFASSNLGDVSPNIKEPRCVGSGEPCTIESSECKGIASKCIAFGPGEDMFESTEIIAKKLFEKALELYNEKGEEINGKVESIHQFVDMTKATVSTFDQETQTEIQITGCLPAMGYSFAAGTTDGPGAFSFKQGQNYSENGLWETLRNFFIVQPSQEQKNCQGIKPIMFPTGEMKSPYEWQPKVISTSVVKIGEFIIAGVPGEFSTMAGRRIRNVINNIFEDGHVVIAGLCNTYSSYVVTPEEYQAQRYEGASTIYGPNTLIIYEDQYKKLSQALFNRDKLDKGIEPNNKRQKLSFMLPVFFDLADYQFGTCLKQPKNISYPGDTISATFVSGHLRNNQLAEESYLYIERKINNNGDEKWDTIATDANWETKLIWKRTSSTRGLSEVTIEWKIPLNIEEGIYRIKHVGCYKKFFMGKITPYQGISNQFYVYKEQNQI